MARQRRALGFLVCTDCMLGYPPSLLTVPNEPTVLFLVASLHYESSVSVDNNDSCDSGCTSCMAERGSE